MMRTSHELSKRYVPSTTFIWLCRLLQTTSRKLYIPQSLSHLPRSCSLSITVVIILSHFSNPTKFRKAWSLLPSSQFDNNTRTFELATIDQL